MSGEDLRTRAIAAIHRPHDIGHSLLGEHVTNPATAAAIVDAVMAKVRAELLAAADEEDRGIEGAEWVIRDLADRITPSPTTAGDPA